MRFAMLSIVDLRDIPFISLLLYETDERGISTLIGEIAKPYNDVIDLLDDLYAYEIIELQTDSKEIYRDLMSVQYPVIYRREVEGPRDHVTRNEKMLVEIFELDKQDENVLPKWRLWCIAKLEKIIQILNTKNRGD